MSDAEFIVKNYFDNPVGYAKDVLKIEKLEQWQEDSLNSLITEQRIAVASGHGIGKTFNIAVIIHWFISTRPHPQIVVTANTGTQLETKTWRELSVINNRALNKDWFTKTATKFFLNDAKDTWFASPISWSEQKPEAFAGTHADHVLYLFDEASAIPDIIWEVSEGAMTTEGARWIAFGNPTKNTGRFRECWGKFHHRWKTFKVDSREVSISDKKQIDAWVEDYGEDSDFVRVRVKGEFPRSGSNQFISSEDVDNCKKYIAEGYEELAVVFGVDVARFGDDNTKIIKRQGRKVETLGDWNGLDTMQTASKVVELAGIHSPDLIFIDGDGVGGGVVDRVKQLLSDELVYEVNSGRTADDSAKYYNKRAENWGKMRDAIKAGIDLPEDDKAIHDDLIAPEYGFDNKNRIQLEKKQDMKRRGLKSPDGGDSLAITYSKDVLKEHYEPTRHRPRSKGWRN